MPNARDLVYIPLAAVTAPLWARKGREAWPERFGRLKPQADPPAGRRRVLLHAVSVGEVSALRGLVPRLAAEADVVVSVTTDTGTARARSLFPGTTIVRYPLDFSWAVRRFLDAVRPDVVGLVELEVWPNFVDACRERAIPVCVLNGRLSERSFRGYRRIRPVIRRAFESLAFAAVQDDEYGRRFEAMGVAPSNCLVTGSMKWDSISCVRPGGTPDAPTAALAQEIAASMGIDRAQPLVVAGSTGPGEEELIDSACRAAFPAGVQLLCAPRKPERFEEAAGALPGCVRRSAVKDRGAPAGELQVIAGAPSAESSDKTLGASKGSGADATGLSSAASPHPRFLLDTIGELRAAYWLADVVVLGRSFIRLYGSDPIEPVSLGRATVIGPRVSDFESVVRTLESGQGLLRATPESLGSVLRGLIDDPAGRAQVAARGIGCIETNRGATDRHAELLLALPAGAPSRRGQ